MNSNSFIPNGDGLNFQLLQQYATENLDYKEKALQLIIDDIGFEPAFRSRYYQEILLRDSVKRYEEGELSADQLENHIKGRCHTIRKFIQRHNPEQIPLLNQFWDGKTPVYKQVV